MSEQLCYAIDEYTSESELITRAKAGDETAQNNLFGQNYQIIFNFLLNRTHDYELAEDLTQETFMNAYKGLASYERRSSGFVAWLYTIAKNAHTNSYRKSRCHVPLVEEDITERPDSLEIAANTPSMDERIVSLDALRAILEPLIPMYRHVLYEVAVEDMSLSDYAEEYGVKRPTVGTRYMRARERARELRDEGSFKDYDDLFAKYE